VLQLRVWYGDSMKSCRRPLFWKRKVRTAGDRDLRALVCLSLRDLQELMAEWGLSVDHTTI
jgi:hypothetical protein